MAKILYPYPEIITFQRAREIHTAKMCDALASLGHEVTWLVGETRGVDEKAIKEKFFLSHQGNLRVQFAPRHLNIGPFKLGARSLYFKRLNEIAKKESFDLYYCIHLKAAAHLLSKRQPGKILFEVHEIFADTYSENSSQHRKLSSLESSIYPYVDFLVTTSTYLLDEIKNRYGLPANHEIAYNAVEDFSHIETSFSPDPDTAIYCGSLIDWKGVDVLIDAWKNVPSKKLIICGGKPEQIALLKMRANKNGTLNRITFTGHLSRQEVGLWLSKAKVAIAPNKTHPKSSIYSFPMKLLEYASYGNTVVASAIPVVQEIAPYFNGLFLCEPENPDSLAEVINEAYLSASGTHMKAPDEFTWIHRAEKISSFISGDC